MGEAERLAEMEARAKVTARVMMSRTAIVKTTERIRERCKRLEGRSNREKRSLLKEIRKNLKLIAQIWPLRNERQFQIGAQNPMFEEIQAIREQLIEYYGVIKPKTEKAWSDFWWNSPLPGEQLDDLKPKLPF